MNQACRQPLFSSKEPSRRTVQGPANQRGHLRWISRATMVITCSRRTACGSSFLREPGHSDPWSALHSVESCGTVRLSSRACMLTFSGIASIPRPGQAPPQLQLAPRLCESVCGMVNLTLGEAFLRPQFKNLTRVRPNTRSFVQTPFCSTTIPGFRRS